MIKVAINGFGRIGRVVLRVILTKYLDKVKPVAINNPGPMTIEGWAHLFEYDSVYGQFKGKVETAQGEKRKELGILTVNHQRIPFLNKEEPAKIPWQKYGVDVVLECSGVFRERQKAAGHLDSGAKKVIISATAKQVDSFIIGANQEKYKGALIISSSSCTTNCVAPVAKVMMDNFGLQKAFVTTIHAYTADQNLVDASHYKDLRRARAAAINIIPTATGAAKATTEVLPGLKGLFDGLAFRVPVACVSVADFTFVTTKRVSVANINKVFSQAAQEKYRGIIQVSKKPLVSTDILGNAASAVVDLGLTKVVDGDLVKIIAWYDNEWAYCCRMIEEAVMVGGY